MKWVHRKAINKRRPPSCTIFRARNHGAILFLKLCNLMIPMTQKPIFWIIKKKYLKFFWGVRGAKPPGRKERLLKQVNISFLIMSKPFQSRLNLPKHEKNLPKLWKIMIFAKNLQKIMNFIPSWNWHTKSTTPDSMEIVSRSENIDFWGFWPPRFLNMGGYPPPLYVGWGPFRGEGPLRGGGPFSGGRAL